MFRYDVDGQQLIAVGGANNTATLLNADKTIGQGVELDLEAYLADNVLLTFGSSYNDTEIRTRTWRWRSVAAAAPSPTRPR